MRIQKNITYLDHKSIYNLLQRGLVASTHSGKKKKKKQTLVVHSTFPTEREAIAVDTNNIIGMYLQTHLTLSIGSWRQNLQFDVSVMKGRKSSFKQ